jgi:hypothetical protein
MKKILKFALLLLALMTLQTKAFAQDQRIEIVKKLVEAQGLKEMFDDQLSQSRNASKKMGEQMYAKTLAAAGGVENARHKAAFERYAAKSTALFSSDEIVARWSALYGQSLTEKELTAILAYYQSPVGKKDVAASKIAMSPLFSWMTEQMQSRIGKHIEVFLQELNEADKPCEKSGATGVDGACA